MTFGPIFGLGELIPRRAGLGCPVPLFPALRAERRVHGRVHLSNVDQKGADSALASAPVDQAMKMTMCKDGDITHLTIVGEGDALMHSFGTRDPDFLSGLIHKPARTFAVALQRYRTGEATVQHVSVGDGAKRLPRASLGPVQEPALKKPVQIRPVLVDARQSPREITSEPQGAPVPLRRTQDDDERPPA